MTKDLPKRVLRSIQRYEPVVTDGMTLYPIAVDEYEEFVIARPAIDFMQQRLPIALMNVPTLQAYYTIDVDSILDEQIPSGLLSRALLFLALALRIGVGEDPEKRARMLRPKVKDGDIRKLAGLQFSPDGEEIHIITPAMFQRWKPILAAQNGIELLPDDTNPELVNAEQTVLSKNAVELDTSIESLVASVAALSGAEEADLYEWPILKLQNRQRALKRAMDYLICGIGEAQGTKWKRGNPTPNPYFDRVRNDSAGAISLDEFADGAGAKAYQQQEQGQARNEPA